MKNPKWIAPISPYWAEPDIAVWIDVKKFDAYWKQTGDDYIGLGGTGAVIADRYPRFGEWLKRGEPVEIPTLASNNETICFTDGRHRFAWFRDHGIEILPVFVAVETMGLIRAQFGVSDVNR